MGGIKGKGRNRKEQVILSRLRMGHSNLNSTLHTMGKHPTGLCNYCQEKETVEHILISCGKYNQERQEMMAQLQSTEQIEGNVKNILDCAEKGQGTKYFFDYLKETGLDKRI